MIRQKKVSELPEATSIEGLVSLGVDASNKSVKIPGNLLKGATGEGVVKGGFAGAVLSKKSNNDYDTEWVSLPDKANLAEGYIVPEEVKPLMQRQTGVMLKGNSHYTGNIAAADVGMITQGDFSIECYFNFDKSSTTAGAIYYMFSIVEAVYIYKADTGVISFQIVNRGENNTVERVNLPSVVVTGTNHIVLSVDRANKTFTGYLNGVTFNKKSFTVQTSAMQNLSLVIGADNSNNAAQEFTAYHYRVFNYALSAVEVNRLYAARGAESYESIATMELAKRCIYEFVPCGVTLKSWKDVLLRLSLTGFGITENRALCYPLYKGTSLTPLFVARGAVFNSATGYYELNGLTDITEEQMTEIYHASAGAFGANASSLFAARYNIRTIYNPVGTYGGIGLDGTFMFCANSKIEIVHMPSVAIIKCPKMFYDCLTLHTVNIYLAYVKKDSDAANMFDNCSRLVNVKLNYLQVSVSLAHSPLLTRDSVLYMVNNSKNTAPITITLHADALARLTEEDIALASGKNITLTA